MHDHSTLRVLDVVVFYVELRGRADLEEDAVGLTFNAGGCRDPETIAYRQVAARNRRLDQAPHTANMCVLNDHGIFGRHRDCRGPGIDALPVSGVGAAFRDDDGTAPLHLTDGTACRG